MDINLEKRELNNPHTRFADPMDTNPIIEGFLESIDDVVRDTESEQ